MEIEVHTRVALFLQLLGTDGDRTTLTLYLFKNGMQSVLEPIAEPGKCKIPWDVLIPWVGDIPCELKRFDLLNRTVTLKIEDTTQEIPYSTILL